MSLPVWAVLVAAGAGKRLGSALPKQYLPLAGRSMLEHSLSRLLDEPLIEGIIVVLAAGDEHWPKLKIQAGKTLLTAVGGAERADSVCAGLRTVIAQAGEDAWALVHDAARPCLDAELLRSFIEQIRDDPVGGLLAAPARDTLKRVVEVRVRETLDRNVIWQAQTPQMFRAGELLAAYETALAAGEAPTDDASAMEAAGRSPRVVEGPADNIKVTAAADLPLAEFILKQREVRVSSRSGRGLG